MSVATQPEPLASSPPVPITALADIAAGLAHIDRSVPLTSTDDPETPRSIRLIATQDYDVWLITWPPGSSLGHHDHAAATSVVRLVSGSLVEFVGGQRRILRPGLSVVTPPHTAHRLLNRQAIPATSLHVYSPPLAEVTFIDPGPGTSLHPAGRSAARGTTPVPPRHAEATSA